MTGPTLSSEYGSPAALRVRMATHDNYSERRADPTAAVLKALRLNGEETLADIGCGDGRFLAHLLERGHRGRIVGLDTSPGMVATVSRIPGAAAIVGDAEQLPFATAEFDRTTARHMLYHVPDPLRALHEFRRITKPGGTVVVAINLTESYARTQAVILERARAYGLAPIGELAFTVGPRTLPGLLRQVFPYSRIERFDDALVFDTPAPLIDFAEAMFSFCGIAADSPHRAAILEQITEDFEAWFAANPGQRWRDPKGFLIATAPVPG
ncbi:class I SAM-dependent methyltransferase [Nocardia sp. NPDC005978]|uniref:class I SAM-dependent methyltransferase n=1 Tax=Nocardia sp. NPDC005978 TaxID=3156725 RepID=UPI0033BADE6A